MHSKNNIYSLWYTGSSGYGAKGIELAASITGNANLSIDNNLVSDLRGDGWTSLLSDAIVGIRLGAVKLPEATILSGTTNGLKLYNNTVNLTSGSYAGYNAATLSAALYLYWGSTPTGVTGIDIRNNIFVSNLVL